MKVFKSESGMPEMTRDRVILSRKGISTQITNEPRREKTGLRGFRPGPTQTGMYKLRKELEA